MTPPCHSFPALELSLRAQEDMNGRRRKFELGTRKVDLSTCDLFKMMQYKCEVLHPVSRDSPVQCFVVERFFRKFSSPPHLPSHEGAQGSIFI